MNVAKSFSRSLAYLLSAVIAIQSVSPLALAQNLPTSSQVSEDFLLDPKVQEDFQKGGIDWAEEQESTLSDLFDLAQKLESDAAIYREHYGEAKLQELINNNHFESQIPGVGIIEYRLIDNKRVPRAVLYRNDTAYLLLDESQIPRNSKHLQQYIARTHMDSGSGRVALDEDGNAKKNFLGFDKKKRGRDLIIVSLTEGKMSDLSYLPKPKPTQWKWWKEYFLSKYKKPTMNDFTLALVFGGALQGALTLGMAAVKSSVLGQEFDVDPAIFTALYGTALGTMYSTYRNWTMLSGSRFTRVLKQTVVSLAYAYGMVLFMSPGDWGDRFASISMISAAGLMKNASITVNALTNNYAKDFWNQIQIIREKLRLNTGVVKGRLGVEVVFTSLSVPVEWKRSTIEGQLFYLIPWTINLISLVTLASSASIKIPGTEIAIPYLQLLAVPFATYLAKMYSKKLYDKVAHDHSLAPKAKEFKEVADKYDQIWKGTFGMKLKEIPRKFKSACETLFLR